MKSFQKHLDRRRKQRDASSLTICIYLCTMTNKAPSIRDTVTHITYITIIILHWSSDQRHFLMTGRGVGESTFVPNKRCGLFSALHTEASPNVEICVWSIIDRRMLMMTYSLRPWILHARRGLALTPFGYDVLDVMISRQKVTTARQIHRNISLFVPAERLPTLSLLCHHLLTTLPLLVIPA